MRGHPEIEAAILQSFQGPWYLTRAPLHAAPDPPTDL